MRLQRLENGGATPFLIAFDCSAVLPAINPLAMYMSNSMTPSCMTVSHVWSPGFVKGLATLFSKRLGTVSPIYYLKPLVGPSTYELHLCGPSCTHTFAQHSSLATARQPGSGICSAETSESFVGASWDLEHVMQSLCLCHCHYVRMRSRISVSSFSSCVSAKDQLHAGPIPLNAEPLLLSRKIAAYSAGSVCPTVTNQLIQPAAGRFASSRTLDWEGFRHT